MPPESETRRHTATDGVAFSTSTLERYRKVRALAAALTATEGERVSATKRLAEMEAKYPTLKEAVSVRDERDRREKAARTPPPPGGGYSGDRRYPWDVEPEPYWSEAPRGHNGPRGPQGPRGPSGFNPGQGPNPFRGAPRARDSAPPPPDNGETLWAKLKREFYERAAKAADDVIDEGERAWDQMAEERIRAERAAREHGGPVDVEHPRAHTRAHETNKARADRIVREARNRQGPRSPGYGPADTERVRRVQQRSRKDYYDMARLDDLLDDPMVTEASVQFEMDPDTDEQCFRFDVSIPFRVWKRLRRNPKALVRWLDEMKADGEDELAEKKRRRASAADDDDDDDGLPDVDEEDLDGEAFGDERSDG